MAAEGKTVKSLEEMSEKELEVRQVKALEKIGRNLEALTIWVEDIDKEDWSSRIQWYLDLLKKTVFDPVLEKK